MVTSKEKFNVSPILIFLFTSLIAGIVLTGYLYYADYKEKFMQKEKQSLSVIGEFRIEQIVQWREERLGDASIVYKNGAIAELLQQSLHGGMDKKLYRQVYRWCEMLQTHNQYDRISIIDKNNEEILVASSVTSSISDHMKSKISETLKTGEVTWVDFYRNEFDRKIYLAILIPIEESEFSKNIVGVVRMRIDPEKYLYPLIKRSSELDSEIKTLFLRKDADSIVFLNELEYQKNAVLDFKISLHQTEVLGVKAAIGKEGIAEGIDYRNVPVIGYTKHIPNTPWFLVAKIDRDIINQTLTEHLWIVISFAAMMFFGLGSAIGLVWRHQRVIYYREKYKTVSELAFLQSVIRESVNEIYIFDEQTLQFTFVNEGASKNLGYSTDELMQTPAYGIKPEFDETSYRSMLQPLVSGEKNILVYETLHRRKDGTVYPVEAHLQIMTIEKGRVFLAIVNDISQRKKSETELRESEEKVNKTLRELERSNKELEQFAYVASHDLQEPLRMVASYTQMLERRYKDKLDTDANEFIHYAVDGANRMQHLINDLLDYSRISTRAKEFVEVDVTSLLGEVNVNLLQKIEENTVVITNDTLPVITADPSQITRLFQNLIDNAIKYRKKDVYPVIHISSADHSDYVEFIVKDNGIGIDPKYHDRIFIIFQRLHSKEEYGGSGIGLAICKRIAERHGGKIWFDSVPGIGTTFHITLSKYSQKNKK